MMIAKLEEHKALNNKTRTKHRTPQTMGATINTDSTTEPPQQPKPPGGLNAFYWYPIFALDLHNGFLTIAMYNHNQINIL